MADQTQPTTTPDSGNGIDDSIPSDAMSGFDDTSGPPAPEPVPTFSDRTWPSAEQVVTAMQAFLGCGEQPAHSNCNAITAWYGVGCVPWCAEAVSKAFFDAGFHDIDGTWEMPGITPTTKHGFAWVPAIRAAFQAAGRFDNHPQVGDIVIVGDAVHTGLVESVATNGVVHTIEGNFSDNCLRNQRTTSITGFCHPPYSSSQPRTSPAIPVLAHDLRMGDTGPDVQVFQRRMAERGWAITVDGQFGSQTEKVVRQFQTDKGLPVDGVVGQVTWRAAWTAPVT